jgi:hypothetical protein
VTNGDFSTDSDWTKGTSAVIADGYLEQPSAPTGPSAYSYQVVPTAAGKVYRVSFDVLQGGFFLGVWTTAPVTGALVTSATYLAGSHELYFVADDSSASISFDANVGTGRIDNISVREINPLSVSIQMDGRMTYADTDAVTTSVIWRWEEDQNNRLLVFLNTNSTATGEIRFNQRYSGLNYVVAGKNYLPDILVPYNFASRHGSTFLNGAADGVSFTEDTTPTALPDLSATDLDLATAYMGTIGTFRVWDQDLGDDGIVTATAPSLEPSLSLTFDGSGLSFTVLDWSE